MNRQNQQNFAHFQKALEALGADLEESAKRVNNQRIAIGVRETKDKTPHVRSTGWLRKNWKLDRQRKVGNAWVGGYSNSEEYGLYVNNGHVIRHQQGGPVLGYVPGVHMLEKGTDLARRQTEAIFRQELARVKKESGF